MNPYWPPTTLTNWLAALRAGEVVAAPAEGVYGYCCDPFSETALCKLMDIKQRSTRKGLIVLIQHERQLGAVCDPLGKVERAGCHDLLGGWATSHDADSSPPNKGYPSYSRAGATRWLSAARGQATCKNISPRGVILLSAPA